MITENQFQEIRKAIAESSTPLFIFDDDSDGICAYILLKKHYKKGIGRAVKTSPTLNATHIPIVREDNYDLVIILDKPLVEQEFFDQVGMKTIWIDHHPPIKRTKVQYYNPRIQDDTDNKPTTYQTYQIVKENLWIAMLGCIADYYLPEFTEEFMKQYPDLIKEKPKDPGEVKYHTPFGKLVSLIAFNIKGKTSEVKKFIKCMEKIETPYEILNKTTEEGKYIYERGEKLKENYDELIADAKKHITKEKVCWYIYPSSKTSYTTDLSNELIYNNQDKIIIVGREAKNEMKMSIRSSNIKLPELIQEALIGLEGHGGGHDYACGCAVRVDQFQEFLDKFKMIIKEKT